MKRRLERLIWIGFIGILGGCTAVDYELAPTIEEPVQTSPEELDWAEWTAKILVTTAVDYLKDATPVEPLMEDVQPLEAGEPAIVWSYPTDSPLQVSVQLTTTHPIVDQQLSGRAGLLAWFNLTNTSDQPLYVVPEVYLTTFITHEDLFYAPYGAMDYRSEAGGVTPTLDETAIESAHCDFLAQTLQPNESTTCFLVYPYLGEGTYEWLIETDSRRHTALKQDLNLDLSQANETIETPKTAN